MTSKALALLKGAAGRRLATGLIAIATAACSQGRADEPPHAPAWTELAALAADDTAFRGDHRIASLHAGPGGRLHALFVVDGDRDGRPDRLLYAEHGGAGWGRPTTIADAAGTVAAPVLAVEEGRVHVFWFHEGAPSGLTRLVGRVRDGGGWTAPATLFRAPADSAPSAVLAAAAGDGRVHVVHPDAAGRLVHAAGDGRGAVPAGRGGLEARLAAGGGGTLALATLEPYVHPLMPPGSVSHNVAWVRMHRGGRWQEPVAIHPDPAQHAHAPQLAWDAEGVLHAVWLQGEGGALFPTRLLHATSADGRTWTAPVDVAPPSGKVLYSPRLAVDGEGVLHLTVARFQEGVTDPVHFHAVLRAAGWSRPAQIVPAAGRRESELETAADSAGRVHAVWQDASGAYRHAVLRK